MSTKQISHKIHRNREKTCPKCRRVFSPEQLVKLFLGSITDSSDDDDESNEIDTVLQESEACLVKINKMMRKMEGIDKEVSESSDEIAQMFIEFLEFPLPDDSSSWKRQISVRDEKSQESSAREAKVGASRSTN